MLHADLQGLPAAHVMHMLHADRSHHGIKTALAWQMAVVVIIIATTFASPAAAHAHRRLGGLRRVMARCTDSRRSGAAISGRPGGADKSALLHWCRSWTWQHGWVAVFAAQVLALSCKAWRGGSRKHICR